MRTVIIVNNGIIQIDMIPENEADKAVLRMIPAGTVLNVGKASGYAPCHGGYLRPFADDEAVQFTFATSIENPPTPLDEPGPVDPRRRG